MIKFENHLGTILVSEEYLINLVGSTVVGCFGVAAMSNVSVAQDFLGKYSKDTLNKGIKIRTKNGEIVIDLHIIVTYGTNISAIVKSIMHKVEYAITEATGYTVARVNVYVDGMQNQD